MNRAERRRQGRGKSTAEGQWRTLFDASPMAKGMPPHFLMYLLNEKQGLARHGKLLTATLWLQSQMVALVCLYENSELLQLAQVEHGRYFPYELARVATSRLEDLSSESLRQKFLECFGSEMSDVLKGDLASVILDRDVLSHGYVSLFQHIDSEAAATGDVGIAWSPRPNRKREEFLESVAGPRPPNTYFRLSLSDRAFADEIEKIGRVMDFIASKVTGWGIPYPVFA